MAQTLNISRVAYTNYELGNREPDFSTMARIAAILGTSADYLLGIAPPASSGGSTGGTAPTDFDQPSASALRLLTLAASSLSPESLEDLNKYITLLTLRDQELQKRAAASRARTAMRARPRNGEHSTPVT